MKVFFAASHRGEKEFGIFYKKIYLGIEKLGYIHLDYELFHTSYEDFYNNLKKGGREAEAKLYQSRISLIEKADICVFDINYPSLAIGYLINKALEGAKPTVVLYYKSKAKNFLPTFISGIKSEHLILQGYNEKNLYKILKISLSDAREHKNKRFNFFISPKIIEYIEKKSLEKSLTKSQFLRNVILDYMQKDPMGVEK